MALDPLEPFDPGTASAPPPATNLTAQAGVAAAPEEPLIFAGWTSYGDQTGGDYRETGGVTPPKMPTWLTIGQFMSRFDNSDREEFLQIRNLMIAAGIVPPGADSFSVRNAFESLLGNVAMMSAQGVKMSPMGYVKNLIRMNGIDPSEVGSGENYGLDPDDQPFTGTKTQVSRSISDVPEGEAWAMLQSNLSRMLGRDPSDQEVRDFAFRMNQLAAENPAITKTIGKFKDGELVSTTTKQVDSGFTERDLQREAYETAQNDPIYAEYQAATTYFNAAQQALGAIGQT